MAHLFKGKDRQMINKGIQLLDAVLARDVKAAAAKKTASISTRTMILDPPTPGTGDFILAAQTLRLRFTTLLDM